MTSTRLLVAPLLLGLALGACDKGTPAPTPPVGEAESGADAAPDPTAGEETADTEPGAPGVPWSEKTFKQRQEHMGIVVLPAMKTMFKAYDETAFKGFKCQTCHGDDMKEVKFAMPTDSIYPLSKENMIEAAMEYDEKVTKFMIEQVVPETAKLLDMEPYNPETGEGFGCLGCHPTE